MLNTAYPLTFAVPSASPCTAMLSVSSATGVHTWCKLLSSILDQACLQDITGQPYLTQVKWGMSSGIQMTTGYPQASASMTWGYGTKSPPTVMCCSARPLPKVLTGEGSAHLCRVWICGSPLHTRGGHKPLKLRCSLKLLHAGVLLVMRACHNSCALSRWRLVFLSHGSQSPRTFGLTGLWYNHSFLGVAALSGRCNSAVKELRQ